MDSVSTLCNCNVILPTQPKLLSGFAIQKLECFSESLSFYLALNVDLGLQGQVTLAPPQPVLTIFMYHAMLVLFLTKSSIPLCSPFISHQWTGYKSTIFPFSQPTIYNCCKQMYGLQIFNLWTLKVVA